MCSCAYRGAPVQCEVAGPGAGAEARRHLNDPDGLRQAHSLREADHRVQAVATPGARLGACGVQAFPGGGGRRLAALSASLRAGAVRVS
jgi:hypothetical protein